MYWMTTQFARAILLLLSGYCAAAAVALGDPNPNPDRTEMQSAFSAYKQELTSLFASAPQSHVMPRVDAVSVSASVEFEDVTIVPKGNAVSSKDRSKKSDRLDLSGWRATPLVAFQATNLGVGFIGEGGQAQAHYLCKERTEGSTERTNCSPFREEFGEIKYSGLGLYGYYIPELRILPRAATLLLVLGGKKLNVVHDSIGTFTNQYAARVKKRYGYEVMRYEAGLDVGIVFARRYTVLPWISYAYAGVGKATEIATGTDTSNSGYFGNSSVPEDNTALVADKNLFWKSAPTLHYGVDFTIQVAKIDIHLGGLLGIVGNFMKSSERVLNNGFTVGLSYDFKAQDY